MTNSKATTKPCVIDADSHISEPHDLWTSRVEPRFRDLVPHVVRGDDGLDTWSASVPTSSCTSTGA